MAPSLSPRPQTVAAQVRKQELQLRRLLQLVNEINFMIDTRLPQSDFTAEEMSAPRGADSGASMQARALVTPRGRQLNRAATSRDARRMTDVSALRSASNVAALTAFAAEEQKQKDRPNMKMHV